MSNMKSNEEPEIRMTKLMAELYYFMAKEMVERMGEKEGKEAISSSISKFGEARVKAMKEEAIEKGMDINAVSTYLAVRDMPSTGWKYAKDTSSDITYCPMEDVWAQYGNIGKELGYLYCQIDNVLFEGFGMKLERPYCIAKGDNICRFNLRNV